VAEILEAKYHVMENFFKFHEVDILQALEGTIQGALENLLVGAPTTQAEFGEAESKIKDAFSEFLSQREVETMGIEGVPTQAARKGVSHRFKHPYARRPRRPSFIDTGTYETSFAAWVD
jgi:hypothetical protein